MAKDYTKAIITDGSETKGIDLPQYPDSAWSWYSGEPDGTEDDPHAKDYYSRVAAVYRAANINANVISSIPFAVLNKSGDEIDNSADWQNEVGFMPNPRELLRLLRLSVFMTNSAYAFREGPENYKTITDLRHLVPTSVEPIVNTRDGLVGFKRSLGTQVLRYPIQDDGWCRIVYMHWLDHTTEALPSKNAEFRALMNAAGVLYHSDEHIKRFFERGGIKPTMLLVKGVMGPDAKEKLESVWDKFIRLGGKYLGKIFQGVGADGGVEPHIIGDGVDNLKDAKLHQQALEDIAMAAGMPLSLLLSNSANYATARQEYASWFQNEVVPKAHWMAECLNAQIFKPMGLRFEFRPEITNEGTQEEKERAGGYSALVASLVKPSAAAQMLGYELPPDYDDYSQLDEDYFEMLRMKSEIQARAIQGAQSSLAPKEPTIAEPKPPRDKVPPDTAEADKSVKVFSVAEYAEAKNWRDISHRKLKRGDSLQFPFTAKELDEGIAASIRQRLPECKTEQDIEDCFDLNNYVGGAAKSELLVVADALNKAVDLITKENG